MATTSVVPYASAMADPDSVQRWLDAYLLAWETYDADDIGALFTDTAVYRWHPWDEGDDVAVGRAAIVAGWLDERDTPGTYHGEMRPLVVTDDVAVAVGACRYYTDDSRSTVDREYRNLWELRFADDGRCEAFTEWYMRVPD